MGRARHLTNLRASSAADLQSLPSMNILRATWKALTAKDSHATSGRLHPGADPQVGLGLLARATVLRAVMKTEIRRDYRNDSSLPSDAAWQIGLANQTHATELFSKDALGEEPRGWLHIGAPNTSSLYDLNWRNKVCHGFNAGQFYVAGLNDWFGNRYRKNLPGALMTDHLLFETRFFGESAIDRYVGFLLHGIYVPGANLTLSQFSQFSDEELRADSTRQDVVDKVLLRLKGPDNSGRPIVTISCKGSPTAASRLATTLVARLGDDMRSACYIPLRKYSSMQQLNDHGFRSIVEAIHRFITGEATLEVSAKEWREPQLAAKLRQVRTHLVKVPTVFVFDGFNPGSSPFPALVSFIRDEPLERILRRLQHPDPGEWTSGLGYNIAIYRQSYFVVIGEPSTSWLSMHRNLTAEFKFTDLDQRNVLKATPLALLKEVIVRTRADQRLATAANEWTFNALSFLERKGAVASPHFAEAMSFGQLLSDAFTSYWNKLKPWQRTYLRALALSESGLRWSTGAQVFESYSRLGKETGASNAEPSGEPVSDESFRKFVEDACEGHLSSPWLFEYSDGLESDSYDVFDYPSEAISRMSDTHSWIVARNMRKSKKQYTVDFRDVEVKCLILQATTPNEALVIRRILAELCLQTFRILVRHSRPVRRMSRRTARSLAEGLFHGFHSLDTNPAVARSRTALPLYTLGEIPAQPGAAFSFLYSVVYKDLLCNGDITNIGRQHGNGDLEMEMLLMIGAAEGPTAERRALDDPDRSVHVPVWFWSGRGRLDATARANSLEYLFAICRCAKRASRASVFRVALDNVLAMHAEEALEPAHLLTLRKLENDLRMISYDGSWRERKAGFRLWDGLLDAVVRCCFPGASETENLERVNELREHLVKMKREVRAFVKNNSGQTISFAPAGIEAIVEKACGNVLKVAPAKKMPRAALTILSRIAAIEAAAAVNCQRNGQPAGAIMGHLVAIAFYWLSKAIVLRQRKDNPLAAAPRVGFSATEGYVMSVSALKDLFSSHPGGNHAQLMNRLCKTARGMLDTFAREQGVGKADHIAVQLLECTFARIVTPSSIHFVKFQVPDSPTGDERLRPLMRCFQWLQAAELEMLSFSGQPALRVMLCRERLHCVNEVLNRAAEHLVDDKKTPIARRLDQGDGEGLRPFAEWMINDLRQLANFINFMSDYSPDARFLKHEWTQTLLEFLSSAHPRLMLWKARDDSAYNQALSMLAQVITDLRLAFEADR